MQKRFNPDRFTQLEIWLIKAVAFVCLLDTLFQVIKRHFGF